jgi:hypothetical protein
MTGDRIWQKLGKRPDRWIVAGTLALFFAGCDGILDVDLPGDVAVSALTNPALAPTLVNSVQGDFECSFAVHILSTSVWTHDLIDSSTWQPVGAWNTRRTDTGGGGTCPDVLFRGNGQWGAYLKLQITRSQGATAFDIISNHPDDLPNKQTMLATAKVYEAYSVVLLSEAYCDITIDEEPLTRADGFATAAAQFQTAIDIAQGAGLTDILNLARVGRARALLNLGDLAGAKQVAEAVPAGFVYNATYNSSPERRINWVAAYNNTNLFVSVPPAYQNLMVDGIPDSRVPVRQSENQSNDSVTPMWLQLLFPDLGDPIPLATYQEAQLIVAEAEVDAGNLAAAVAAINRVRDMYDLPLYGGGSASAVMNQVIEERRRTLYLQSHRIGDMLRYGLPFDQGADHKGRVLVNANTCLVNPEAFQ